MLPQSRKRLRNKNRKKLQQEMMKRKRVPKVPLMRNPWQVTKKTSFRINKVVQKFPTNNWSRKQNRPMIRP